MTSPDNVEYNQYPEYTGFNSGFISGFGNKNQSTKSSIVAKQVIDENKKLRFKLKSQESDDLVYKPEKRNFSFYQICGYPIDDKYHVRKNIFDENYDIIEQKESYITKKELRNFTKGCSSSKYTIYSTYNLDVVGMPNANEIMMAGSTLL